jgi:hypothetical protein
VTSTIPDKARFLEVVNAADDLHVVIRGHQLVEEALNSAISEALPEPHALEVSKLSFALKIDLASALRVVRSDSRPSLRAINRIRNRFAHQPNASLSDQEALDLRNLLSPWQRYVLGNQVAERDSPRSMLRMVMAVAFIEARNSARRLEDQKVADEVMHDIVEETLAGVEKTPETEKHRKQLDDELRERLEQKKRDRAL